MKFEHPDPVERALVALKGFVLLKRELEWYRREEPQVYGEIREAIKKAIEPRIEKCLRCKKDVLSCCGEVCSVCAHELGICRCVEESLGNH